MNMQKTAGISLDPRTGLLMLVVANLVAFIKDSVSMELAWILVLVLLFLICGYPGTALRWGLGFLAILALQWYVLPVSPKIIATSFSIFLNYARRSYSCLAVGRLMLRTMSLRRFIVALRKLHFPQKLIIPISVTLRYFPAIREETGYIRDAMKLRSIRGLDRAEAMLVPLMISATEAAEELSAAAVTRGIENPAPKTTLVRLKMGALDYICLLLCAGFTAAVILV